MTQRLKYDEINVQHFELDDPQFSEVDECHISNLLYNNDERCIVQSPKMKILEDVKHDGKNYYLYIEPDEKFYNTIRDLDIRIQNLIIRKSSDWFSVKMTKYAIEEIYKSVIWSPIKYMGKPYMKFRIPIIKNSMACTIFDKIGNKLTVNELTKNTEVQFAISMDSVKFYKNKFYIDYNIIQVKLPHYPNNLNTEEFLFNDETEEAPQNNLYSVLDSEMAY